MEFINTFTGVFLGAALAIRSALWLNKRNRKEKQKQLIAALRTAIDRNIGFLKQLTDELNSNWTPTYNLDLSVLDATSHVKYELIDSIDVCRIIDEMRYELDHANRKIDFFVNSQMTQNPSCANQLTSLKKYLPEVIDTVELAQWELARLTESIE